MNPQDDLRQKELLLKAKYLMALRVAVVTAFLGTILIFKHSISFFPKQAPLTSLIIATYLLTILYSLLWRRVKSIVDFCYAQIIGDVFIVTGIIYATGGIDSPFSFLYILSIISASIILPKPGNYLIAAASSLFYSVLITLHFFGLLQTVSFLPQGIYLAYKGDLIYRLFVNLSAFFLVAHLSGYLAEKLRVTGRRLSQQSDDLHELKAFHENIVNSIRSGIFTAQLNGSIISFNKAAEEISGYKAHEVLGRDCCQFFRNLNLYSLFLDVARGKSGQYRVEGHFASKEGQKTYLGMSLSPLKDDTDRIKGVIGVFQDLTSVHEMKERMERSERLAAIGRIAAGIAHEIRNPLASMSGSVQILRDELMFDPSKQQLMDIVLREMDNLNSIITEFLDFARPSSVELAPCSLGEVIDETVALLKNCADYRDDISVITRYGAPAIMALADRGKLKQVLWNLCLNSIQAMGPGGTLCISARAGGGGDGELGTKSRSEQLEREAEKGDAEEIMEIIVQDTGAGIPEKDIPKIFEPFFTTKDRGTGLGLAIVHRIIEDHGGDIAVESEAGKGTRVTIKLRTAIGLRGT